MGVETVVGIAVISYLIGMGVKAYKKIPNDYIPVIVGACGAALGALGLYVIPEFPANNIIDAIAIGIASGLTATGVHEGLRLVRKS